MQSNAPADDSNPANSPDQQAAAEHHYFHKDEAPHSAEWSYAGATGPEHWGDLSTEYALAKTGKQQSPVNMADAETKSLPSIKFDYKPAKIDLVYNGHTIEEVEAAGSSITVGDKRFELKQFHFHSPSEHTIDGKHTALEMHLVHKSRDGSIAVVAVMLEQGPENQALDKIWNYLPTEKNRELKYAETIDAATLLPTNRGYYHYMGSFTTPPCSEGVFWYVLKPPIEISPAQINRFQAIISGNNRPIQPLNGREITSSH